MAIRPLNRIACRLHKSNKLVLRANHCHRLFDVIDTLEFPTVALERGAVFSRADRFQTEGLLIFGQHREVMRLADLITQPSHLLDRAWTELNFFAVLVADAVDNEMIMHALNTVALGIKMCADEYLVAGKHLLGKLDADAVRFIVRGDLAGAEGLLVMIKVRSFPLAEKIFRRHKLLVG